MRWITTQWARLSRYFPRVRDVIGILISLTSAVGTTVQRWDNDERLALIEGALGAVAAASLWWRRSRPVAVVGVTMAVTLLTGVATALFLALATLMVRRREPRTVVLAVLGIGAFMIGQRHSVLHEPSNDLSIVPDLINSTILVGFLVAGAAYIGTRRDLVRNLQDRAEQAEAEREIREEQARSNERTRIAREMHDVLAHKVSLIALQAGALEVTNTPTEATVRESASLIRTTARQALEDLREVLGVLRDTNGDVRTKLAPQATLADIVTLVESSRQAGLPVTLTGTADLHRPAADLIQRAAYRLVQEALTNVHKHARNATTTVRIDGAPGARLDIEVVNLRPVSADQLLPGSGHGLIGLRERVDLVSGRFEAGPTAEGGFRVHASLPWIVEEFAIRPVSRT